MTISFSAVLLLGIVLAVLIRGKSLKAGPAIVSVLFGFFLADTGMAPEIEKFVRDIAELVNSIDF